jgi:type III secretion protein C
MHSILRFFCCLMLSGWLMTGMGWASPPPWPDASFTYIASHEKVSQVFIGFSRTFGLQIQLTRAAQDDPAMVNGKITSSNPSEFLDQLGASYGMTWFCQSGTLYISKSTERLIRAIQPPGMQIESMKAALMEVGIFEKKFGWGEIQDRGVALVSGPPAYVEMVTQAVAELPLIVPDQQIEVFRLRHAQVEDRTVFFRDKQITTPGVATILRNLITGENRRGASNIQLVELAQSLHSNSPVVPLDYDPSGASAQATRGQVGVAMADDAGAASSPASRRTNVVATGAPGWLGGELKSSIQSDPILNAIIIKDRPERIKIYKQLIAALDVPSEQIEIEAIVIDINSSKMTQLGVDWTGTSGNLTGGFGTPNAAPGPTTLTLGANPVGIVSNVGSFLLARLQLLQSDGSAKIISRIPLLTMDNIGAVIDTSDTLYVQTTTSSSSSGTGSQTTTATTPITVGATMKVTPHIIHDGEKKAVELFVDIDDSGVQNISTVTPPTVRRTTIGTQAVISDSEGLLIGGFSSDQALSQKDAVPILGQIPIIGALFSKTSTDVEKTERMFLIVPRVRASPVN